MTSNRFDKYQNYQDPRETIKENNQMILEAYSVFRNVNEIKYKGYLDNKKRENITRIMSVNVNRLRPDQKEKMIQFKEYVMKQKIDIALLTEMNAK